jgi:UrcA family protein
MPRLLPLACACALVFAAASPTLAQEARSEVVSFADLDLDDAYDADRLIDRVQDASDWVCGFRYGVQPLSQWDSSRACAAETTELTLRDFGHPVVLAQYYGVHPRVIIEEGDADPYYDDSLVVRKK